jgi:hypothetical protein
LYISSSTAVMSSGSSAKMISFQSLSSAFFCLEWRSFLIWYHSPPWSMSSISARLKWGHGALEDQLSCSFFLVFANQDPFSDKGVLSTGFTSSVTYHSVDPPLGLPRADLPPFLALSADRIESRFFVVMKWLPFGFPGSVAWEFLPPIWHGALEMTTFDNWPD